MTLQRASVRRDAAPGAAERIVDRARMAPSIHNTQPWRWRLRSPAELELWADQGRRLVHADADGRQLVVSCGTALHHALVAAHAYGFRTEVERVPDPAAPDLLARVHLAPAPLGAPVDPRAVDDLLTISERSTDRRRFTRWPVAADRVARVARAAAHPDVQLLPLTAPRSRRRVDLLTEQARLAQAHDPVIVAETASWVDRGSHEGIPRAVVPVPRGLRGEHPHRFDTSLVDGSERLVEATEGLVVLLTATDGPLSWLRAGEAASALWLAATREGFSVVPLSQVVEHATSRAALAREVPGPLRRPQLLLRLGWQQIDRSTLPRTPRRPLRDVLDLGDHLL